ncbi:hypothetical protein [Asticcacaulis sp. AC460]|uniref:hypothetical protein n=1 Tax=Asticcacaulis sp. AC460 TaxID=1282360 RepID=UPI0012DFD69F|nr:hypothetical protein [Asticcacaulis sp. AC460]
MMAALAVCAVITALQQGGGYMPFGSMALGLVFLFAVALVPVAGIGIPTLLLLARWRLDRWWLLSPFGFFCGYGLGAGMTFLFWPILASDEPTGEWQFWDSGHLITGSLGVLTTLAAWVVWRFWRSKPPAPAADSF